MHIKSKVQTNTEMMVVMMMIFFYPSDVVGD